MNKKDAAIYKILAECGFDCGSQHISDSDKDSTIKTILDPQTRHLEDILRVFDGKFSNINDLFKLKNK